MQLCIIFTGFCLLATASVIHSYAIHAPLKVISLEDVTAAERSYLQSFADQMKVRTRRSGAADLITPIKNTIASGVKSKIGYIAQGSSAALSHFGKGSSSGGDDHHQHHETPHSYQENSFDLWALKKNILSTLLQAAKAIKGGVIAVKGQLIKGGGKLISAKGRFISHNGDLLTNLGKHLASTAILNPHKQHEDHAYEHHTAYSHPVPHADYGSAGVEYGAPDQHGPPIQNEYLPQKYHSSYEEDDQVPQGSSHHGVVILKKIPPHGHGHDHYHEHHEHHHEHESKHKKPSKHELFNKISELVGSLFSASAGIAASASSTAVRAGTSAVLAGSSAAIKTIAASSSKDEEEKHNHHHDHHEHHGHHDHHEHHGHHDHHEHYVHHDHHVVPPHFDHFEEEYGPHSSASEYHFRKVRRPSYRSSHPTHPPPLYMRTLKPNYKDDDTTPKIPATNYGVPILRHPKDQNLSPSEPEPLSKPEALKLLSNGNNFENPPQYLEQLKDFSAFQNSANPNLFIGMNLPLGTTDFSGYGFKQPTSEFTTFPPLSFANDNLVNDLNNQLKTQTFTNLPFKSLPPSINPNTPSLLHGGNDFANPLTKKHVNDKPTFLPTPTTNLEQPTLTKNYINDKTVALNVRTTGLKKTKKPSFDVVRSVTYELGPNGPIKL